MSDPGVYGKLKVSHQHPAIGNKPSQNGFNRMLMEISFNGIGTLFGFPLDFY